MTSIFFLIKPALILSPWIYESALSAWNQPTQNIEKKAYDIDQIFWFRLNTLYVYI